MTGTSSGGRFERGRAAARCCRPIAAAALLLTAGCSVQLAAPYDPGIAKEANDLQLDFLRFAANMQTSAGTPKGYYSEHEADYNDFEARLAVIQLRSENQGGVPCSRALGAVQGPGDAAASSPLGQQIRAALSGPAAGNASCITILARLAEGQLDDLRRIHQLACGPSKPPRECRSVFASPPLSSVLNAGQSQAPAVSAVVIVLNELVRQEQAARQSMKP